MALARDGQGQDTGLAGDGEEALDTATVAVGAPGAGLGLAFTALTLIPTSRTLIPAPHEFLRGVEEMVVSDADPRLVEELEAMGIRW